MISDISISGGLFGATVVGVVLVIAGLVMYLRRRISHMSAEKVIAAHKGEPVSIHIRKYPEADIFRQSGTYMRMGLVAALLIVLFGFNWTQYEKQVYIPDNALALDEEIQIEPPRTAEPPPPPPPPPPPVIQEVPDEEIEEDQPEFKDQSVEVETRIEAPPVQKEAPPPPPPPPPKEEEPQEIFKVVEEMPRFPASECENLSGDAKTKKECADKKMLEFIYKNIKYPAIARENGVEGTVVVTFVVERDGSVKEAKIVRDVGAQCGDEALRVVNLMNTQGLKWIPGKQRGKSVRVQFNLPVKFKLEG